MYHHFNDGKISDYQNILREAFTMKNTADTAYTENIGYLRKIFGDEKMTTFISTAGYLSPVDSQDLEDFFLIKKCLDFMDKFSDNHWWTSDDERVMAYYQMMSHYILVPYDRFESGLELLLGHPVSPSDLCYDYSKLRLEAEEAFRLYQISKIN